MLSLLADLKDIWMGFNLFNYVSFRTGGAIITAFLMSLAIGPAMISWLKSLQGAGQPIRTDGPETHFKKAGTPTMGGLLILITVTASTILWAHPSNPFVWLALLVMVGFGLLGFGDDYLKLTKRNTDGLSGRKKLIGQLIISLFATYGFVHFLPVDIATSIAIPFFKHYFIPLGVFFFIWAAFVMIGASNAVNLTDGLDGLAIVPVAIAAACFGLIAYLVGRVDFSEYLQIAYVPGTAELSILCGALVGGAMGFLWFNAPPAMIFMGDTGSLSMGGVLGAIAIMVKHELVLAIVGGIFVMETVSVIIQVASFKLRGKRVFLMAPIHHHYEKKGWSESTVVIRFWIIAVILALIGLSTLKLR
ncbi:MAG: phospho-N-acetylmuramoyl-pentapeptide-transferase [Alphaproteobacteria bacterium]|nr:phospho-N-acetylmuramoyl-pentapeptide-transferase [Alphaproteobacteria bacterium]